MAKRKFVNFIPRPKPRKRPGRHTKRLNKHKKRCYKVYASKADFDSDVANPDTDTTSDDLQINQKITVASMTVFGKTKT